MNKKSLLIVSSLLFTLFSCDSLGGSKESLLIEKVYDIYHEKKISLNINYGSGIKEIYVDKESFYVKDENLTYYKNKFLDGYQKYDENLIENNLIIQEEENYSSFISICNPLLYSDNNFKIENDVFKAKKDKLSKFKLPFINLDILSLKVSLDNSTLIYNYGYDNYNIVIKVDIIDNDIYDFYYEEYPIDNFYKSIEIQEYDNEIETFLRNEDVTFIYMSKSCGGCHLTQEIYRDIYFEYELQNKMYAIDINYLESNLKQNLLLGIIDCYNNQDEIFKINDYETYGNVFVTPTMVRYINGSAKYVKLSISYNESSKIATFFSN